MKVLVRYSTTTYGCQQNKEGVQGDWMSMGSDSQILELTPSPKLSLRVQALKALEQPYQFGNSYTVYSQFEVTVVE